MTIYFESDTLLSLIQTYEVCDSAGAKLLNEALRNDWDIFNIGSESIQLLIQKLCASIYAGDDDIFYKPVIMPKLADDDFCQTFGVIGKYTWEEFSNSIKHKNRFHSKIFNADAFASFLSVLAKKYPSGTHLFRARISLNKIGFSTNDMGAPPKNKRSAGRINPEGVSVLYLSSDNKTVLHEMRASTYDYVTIGEFASTQEITVVNLSAMPNISPFLHKAELEQYATNRQVFQEIALEIAKPLRRTDTSLEYVPTQYIAEFIKSERYCGVEYASTLSKGGYNLAIFNEELFECVDVKTLEVSKISYETRSQV